jgi:hypothetical protein
MNEQEFFDLALKVIAQQASEAERAELDTQIARQPELKAEFERLQGDSRLAREILPLVNATEATAPELPAYVRERLQTKVRQTLGQAEPSAPSAGDEERRIMWRWRWLLGLAAATAVIALVAIPLLRQAPAPVIQIAMLDPAGASRGADSRELVLFQHTWTNASVDLFSAADKVRTWETDWPADGKGALVKVLYDRPAGELRVLGRWSGKTFAKTFVVEQDFGAALGQAKVFITEQTSH